MDRADSTMNTEILQTHSECRTTTLARLFAGTKFDIPPTCDRCGELEEVCECPEPVKEKQLLDPAKQLARITVEKRKKGKVVTVVNGLSAINNDLPSLCTELKNTCGAGGTVDGDTIEIQGQHAQSISEKLAARGYRVKVTNETVKKK